MFDDLIGKSLDIGLDLKPKKKKKKIIKKSKTITSTKRGILYAADKDTILRKQKGKCAGKYCAKEHGKKMDVNIRSHFDHIKALALGGKNIPSNLQALCANCHQLKTREDHKKIAEAKKAGKIKIKPKKKTIKKTTTTSTNSFGGSLLGTPSKKKRLRNPFDLRI